MDSEKRELRIDLKAFGRTIGLLATPNKPNIGKKPKDGDGDGFVVNLATGLDNVPYRKPKEQTQEVKKQFKKYLPKSEQDPNNKYDEKDISEVLAALRGNTGSGKNLDKEQKENIKQIKESLKKRGMADEDISKEIEVAKEEWRKTFNPNPVEYAEAIEQEEAQSANVRDGDGNRGKATRIAKRYATYWQGGGRMSFEQWSKLDKGRNPKDYQDDSLSAYQNRKSFSPMEMISNENTNMQIRLRDDEDAELSPRQRIMYEFFELIAKKMGKWEKGIGADGAHYVENSPFKAEGMICLNCSLFQGGNRCEVVSGDIDPNAICKLWVIREDLLKGDK